MACQAEAQTGPADPRPASIADATQDSDADGVVEIVVTAQKRSESLQSVPAAVTVVDGERLTALGVTSLTQLPNLTTGISITPLRTQTFTFVRGVGQTVTSPNADPAVATNLNGVYLPAEVTGTAFFDVDRIEILPGPQGTLYGRNAAGGVINLTGRSPGDVLSVEGFAEIGNYERRQLVLSADLPLADGLGLRVAGTIIRHDGYANNGLDDERTSAVKARSSRSPDRRPRSRPARPTRVAAASAIRWRVLRRNMDVACVATISIPGRSATSSTRTCCFPVCKSYTNSVAS